MSCSLRSRSSTCESSSVSRCCRGVPRARSSVLCGPEVAWKCARCRVVASPPLHSSLLAHRASAANVTRTARYRGREGEGWQQGWTIAREMLTALLLCGRVPLFPSRPLCCLLAPSCQSLWLAVHSPRSRLSSLPPFSSRPWPPLRASFSTTAASLVTSRSEAQQQQPHPTAATLTAAADATRVKHAMHQPMKTTRSEASHDRSFSPLCVALAAWLRAARSCARRIFCSSAAPVAAGFADVTNADGCLTTLRRLDSINTATDHLLLTSRASVSSSLLVVGCRARRTRIVLASCSPLLSCRSRRSTVRPRETMNGHARWILHCVSSTHLRVSRSPRSCPLAVSLAENSAAKDYMHANSAAANKAVLPQIFLNGAFKGVRIQSAHRNRTRPRCRSLR